MAQFTINGGLRVQYPSSMRNFVIKAGQTGGFAGPKMGTLAGKPAPVYTLSAIKADVGSWVGHTMPHINMLERAEEHVRRAVESPYKFTITKEGGNKTDYEIQLIDGAVSRVGDDGHLWMTHTYGEDSEIVHAFAWFIFNEIGEMAKNKHLYGAKQDLLSSEFSGNVQGMGPGKAEMEITERPTEPIIIFAADKTSPFAWNGPSFEMFASAQNSVGLVVDQAFHRGFAFEIKDLKKDKNVILNTPEDIFNIQALIGTPNFAVERIYHRGYGDKIPPMTIALVTSTSRLSFIANKYVGKDDPVMVVRSQSGFPAVGEVLNPFAFPRLVPGGMRGSCWRPLMPDSILTANPTYNDGPPRVVAAGVQMRDGQFGAFMDHLGDKSFDHTRAYALQIADYMQKHGSFEPGILPDEDLEYGGRPKIMAAIAERFGTPAEIAAKVKELRGE